MVNILAKSFLIFEVVLLFLPCHHNNPPNFQVRNSAAFLLVSLVPSPHFRQTFRTPRNPPSQLRESIEALDGIDTVRRLLEFLLSLLRFIGIFLKKQKDLITSKVTLTQRLRMPVHDLAILTESAATPRFLKHRSFLSALCEFLLFFRFLLLSTESV